MPARDVIVIGASAGGVEALVSLAGALPADLAAAVLVCLHVSSRQSQLPRILARAGQLPATHAVDGDPLWTGHILVAPPGLHLAIERGRVRLAFGAHENGHRPSIDVLFRTAAWAYGARVIGVVLTGRLDDGAAGLATIRKHGGLAIVQDPESAPFPDMPRAAQFATTVDHCVALDDLGPLLIESTGAPHPARMLDADGLVPLPEVEVGPAGALEPAASVPVGSDHPHETPALLSCPTCHGALWRTETGDALQFRCRVGHAFAEGTMVAGQDDKVDEALWTALRALEEQRELLDKLASRAKTRGADRSARRFTERAERASASALQIRAVLKDKGKDGPVD